MSNARKLAANLPKEGQLSGRNIIINGAMEVAQRGTSHTTAGFGSIDRMSFSLSGGTGTMSQQYMTVSDKSTTGFAHYMRMNFTAGNNNAGLYYKIEAKDIERLQGKKMTLSFWAKGTNPGGGNFKFGHYWYDADFGDIDNGVSQNFSVTSTWTQYSITFDLATASLVIVGNNPAARYDISILQPAGDTSTNAWQLDITGLMLEVGESPSPYEHESYHVTLAKCQRYFQHHQGQSWTIFLNGTKDDSHAYLNGPLTQVMRTRPSFSTANCYLYGRPSGVVSYGTSENRCNTGHASIGFHNVTGSIDAGEGVRFESNNNAGYVRYDAEL